MAIPATINLYPCSLDPVLKNIEEYYPEPPEKNDATQTAQPSPAQPTEVCTEATAKQVKNVVSTAVLAPILRENFEKMREGYISRFQSAVQLAQQVADRLALQTAKYHKEVTDEISNRSEHGRESFISFERNRKKLGNYASTSDHVKHTQDLILAVAPSIFSGTPQPTVVVFGAQTFVYNRRTYFVEPLNKILRKLSDDGQLILVDIDLLSLQLLSKELNDSRVKIREYDVTGGLLGRMQRRIKSNPETDPIKFLQQMHKLFEEAVKEVSISRKKTDGLTALAPNGAVYVISSLVASTLAALPYNIILDVFKERFQIDLKTLDSRSKAAKDKRLFDLIVTVEQRSSDLNFELTAKHFNELFGISRGYVYFADTIGAGIQLTSAMFSFFDTNHSLYTSSMRAITECITSKERQIKSDEWVYIRRPESCFRVKAYLISPR